MLADPKICENESEVKIPCSGALLYNHVNTDYEKLILNRLAVFILSQPIQGWYQIKSSEGSKDPMER